MESLKTLILGLGNLLRSDDGVGLCVARELEGRVDRQGVTVVETSQAGLGLLDLLTGYDRAIIIDAIQTVGGEVGKVYRLHPDMFDAARHVALLHGVDFTTALELGNRLGMALPRQVVIFAIEVADVSTFSDECTPEVKRAIPVCIEMVIRELSGDHDG